MISHKYKFIFIHAPKTAGNSIQNNLLPYSDTDISVTEEQNRHNYKKAHLERFELNSSEEVSSKYFKEDFKIHKHSMLDEYYENWKEGCGEIENFFKFGVVRNPWERAISYYFFLKRIKKFTKNEFIDRIKKHMRSCFDFFYVSKYGESKLDYVMKFENLQNDFDIACDKIGIPRKQLPHTNKNNHKHYTEYYDDETRAIIAEKYAKDIEYFGYKFGD